MEWLREKRTSKAMSESNLPIYHLYLDFTNYCSSGRFPAVPASPDVCGVEYVRDMVAACRYLCVSWGPLKLAAFDVAS